MPAADGRGWKYCGSGLPSLSVKFWPISDEPTDLAVDLDDRPVGLVAEGDLADPPHREREDAAEQHDQADGDEQAGEQLAAQHQCTPSPAMTRSMSLMPTNGAITPPTP